MVVPFALPTHDDDSAASHRCGVIAIFPLTRHPASRIAHLTEAEGTRKPPVHPCSASWERCTTAGQ